MKPTVTNSLSLLISALVSNDSVLVFVSHNSRTAPDFLPFRG